MIAHRWHTPKRLGWLTFCQRCGILNLKNEATYKRIKKGCYADWVPE